MKANIDVSIIQFCPELLEVDSNIDRMRTMAHAEATNGAKLIIFPELSNTGYVEPAVPGEAVCAEATSYGEFARKFVKASEPVPGKSTTMLTEIARCFQTFIVVGIARQHPSIPGVIYNSALLIGPAGVLGIYDKIHLWHMEKLYFAPGNAINAFQTDIGKIGLQICYDIRFPEITRVLSIKGAEIVCCIWSSFYPESSPVADLDLFKHRAYTRAQENGLFFLCCNRAGSQGRNRFFGRSVIASPNGNILAASDSEHEEVIRAKLDMNELINYRSTVNIFSDRRPQLYREIVSDSFASNECAPYHNASCQKQMINHQGKEVNSISKK